MFGIGVQKFILESVGEAYCMSCKHEWNREFIVENCTKTFVFGEYRKHREQVIFDREKCLMPETQHIVVKRRKIDEINLQIRELKAQLNQLHNQPESSQMAEERRKFIKKCPLEDCKGFLSTQWKCQLCEKHICRHCYEEKVGDQHQCDPDTVQTVEAIEKDSKGCPNCGILISRISGCQQMWCPECHCAFNWNTLRLETGVIHNPHYFAFMRQHGQVPEFGRNNGACDENGLVNRYDVMHYVRSHCPDDSPIGFGILRLLRFAGHELDRGRFIERCEAQNATFLQELRIKYMINELCEEEYKKLLQRHEKKASKERDVQMVRQMFVTTASDLLRALIQDNNLIKFAEMAVNILEYTCNELQRIARQYNNKIYDNEYRLELDNARRFREIVHPVV